MLHSVPRRAQSFHRSSAVNFTYLLRISPPAKPGGS